MGPKTAASFGLWLKARRYQIRLSQAELARRVPCSVMTIRKLESDDRRPSKELAERLALALELDPVQQAGFVAFARSKVALAMRPAAPPLPSPLFQPSPDEVVSMHRLTPLIGREREVAEICAWLTQRGARLLTLLGPPGIGKTRLALGVANALENHFANGVVFVALASMSDPALVLPAIAQALGVKEIGGEAIAETVKRALANRQILLVLDNFEQVLASAPSVEAVMIASPGLTVLLTSRTALDVYAEQRYRVPPLAIPDMTRQPTLAELADVSSIALFVERAGRVQPDFRLDAGNAAVLGEICARLDGLPLAIELAAAWVSVFPPKTLLAQLAHPLPLLVSGSRDRPARQQTLRAALDWSYLQLNADEQRLLVRLGVFVGGCTLEAAEEVCGDETPGSPSVAEGIRSLLDKSLLQRVDSPGEEPRFTLLELVREYALERLAQSGETEHIRGRHGAYYLALARAVEPRLRSTEQIVWFDRLDRELGNLRAAIDYFHEQPAEVEQELWLVGSLWAYWIIQCRFAEGRERYLAVLDRASTVDNLAPARALALLGLGFLERLRGGSGEMAGTESLALFRQLGDQWGIAQALNLLGLCAAFEQYDYERGARLLEESLTISCEIGDQWCIGLAYANCMNVYRASNDLRRVELLLERYLRFCQESRNPYFLADVSGLLGFLNFQHKAFADSQHFYQESMMFSRSLRDQNGVAMALSGLGQAAMAQHNHGLAVVHFEASLAIWQDLGNPSGIAETLMLQGFLAFDQHDFEAAANCYDQSLRILQGLGDKTTIAWLGVAQGYLALAQDDLATAATYWWESLHTFWAEKNVDGCAHGLVAMAVLAVARGQLLRAAHLLSAVDALLDQRVAWLNPMGQQGYCRAATALASSLYAQALATIRAEGSAMPLEDAVTAALEKP